MDKFSFHPIGYIRSCFSEKFGIPRQPGLVPDAPAYLELVRPFHQEEAFRGLESFSHIWILFVFHACESSGSQGQWKTTIRPPRLGGNQRVGVFASRSGFRPNAIGQSVVTFLGLENINQGLRLRIGGADLLDGTPVLDVKPYLPYVDSIPDAKGGYAPLAPEARLDVRFSHQAAADCDALDPIRYPKARQLIGNLLSLDPRPAYQRSQVDRSYGMRLWDLNIRFRATRTTIIVESVEMV